METPVTPTCINAHQEAVVTDRAPCPQSMRDDSTSGNNMVFRLFATVTFLLAQPASWAMASNVTICLPDMTTTPPTAETLIIEEGAWPMYENMDALLGECREYLGEICDDGDMCTVDYYMDTERCLPFPRNRRPECAEE